MTEVIRRALAELAIKAFCKGFWFRLDQLRATQTWNCPRKVDSGPVLRER
ncbi:hypothetical protein RBSWK_03184 [Rhodopirellula baltica SWK14]|uniref:Uncharacterized protein n=1 Tax=Rhodopirellula baltica SWK14 TaxID=993516 RepID=L7CGZ5_RHOBT|nr:hypothetical protein RBSWK_03184 [Rhodopirellula baltica SWK14]